MSQTRSICGELTLQHWEGDHLIPMGNPLRVDLTRIVLSMRTEDIRRLSDDSAESDRVAIETEDMADHNGPFTLHLEKGLNTFFGVDHPSKITDEIHREAATEFGFTGEKKTTLFLVSIPVLIEDTRFAGEPEEAEEDRRRRVIGLAEKRYARGRGLIPDRAAVETVSGEGL